jgi:hypothetical protein
MMTNDLRVYEKLTQAQSDFLQFKTSLRQALLALNSIVVLEVEGSEEIVSKVVAQMKKDHTILLNMREVYNELA